MVRLQTVPSRHALSVVQAELNALVDRLRTGEDRITITIDGQAIAVLMSVDEFERLEETLAVLASRELVEQMSEADLELAAGAGEGAAALEAAMEGRASSESVERSE